MKKALDLINQLDKHQPSQFLAPVLDAHRVRIHALLEGIPYRFDLYNARPGWWVLEPTNSKTKAQIIGPPKSMKSTLDYLRNLPRFLVIALFRVRHNIWLVTPFNSADAEQRGWPNSEPRQLHLCRHRVQPFDILEARQLGSELIFHLRSCAYGHSRDATWMRESLLKPELPEAITRDIPGMALAWEILREHIKEQQRQERLRAIEAQKATVEGRLRHYLEFMGAELNSWYESGEGYRVNWTHEGQSYSVGVARSGFIESAGVCLNDSDMRHNLSSIVAVMNEHRRLGRRY